MYEPDDLIWVIVLNIQNNLFWCEHHDLPRLRLDNGIVLPSQASWAVILGEAQPYFKFLVAL